MYKITSAPQLFIPQTHPLYVKAWQWVGKNRYQYTYFYLSQKIFLLYLKKLISLLKVIQIYPSPSPRRSLLAWHLPVPQAFTMGYAYIY